MIDAKKVVKKINELLVNNRYYRRELYEILLSEKIVPPNSEKEFSNLIYFAIDEGLVERTRMKGWTKKKGKLPRYFTKKQLIDIFDAIDRPKDMITCFVALMCGLRVSEVCSLQIGNIDFEKHRMLVRDCKNTNREKQGGYGKDRYVIFDPAIDNILKRWIEIVGDTGKWFVCSDKTPDRPLVSKSIHERFKMYMKEAKLLIPEYKVTAKQKIHGKLKEKIVTRHRYTFHCFRHTMACIIYNSTGDIYLVKEFLGHEQVETTMVYTKIINTKMKSSLSKVFASLRGPTPINSYIPHQEKNYTFQEPTIQAPAPLNAFETIRLQYANGQITEEEYAKKKKVLLAD